MAKNLLGNIGSILQPFVVLRLKLTLSPLPTFVDPMSFFEEEEFFFPDVRHLRAGLFVVD